VRGGRLSPLYIALTPRVTVYLVRIGSCTRPDPSQRRTSIEQRFGASRRATKLPMLSLRSSPCFTFFPTIHLSTTRSPACPVVSVHPSRVKVWGIYAAMFSKGGFESTCGRMPALKCERPHECCPSLEQCVFQRSFRQICYHSLPLSVPPRRLTQETSSTPRVQRGRHTIKTIVLHPVEPPLLLSQHLCQDIRNEINGWGVLGELWVKEAIHMSSVQQKTCAKCGQYPTAGNQLRRCGSCLAVKYCSSVCQTEDWASHRLVCKNVGAARKEELMPLMFAAQDGDVATVERLLKAGAKVDGGALLNDDEAAIIFTPLLMAATAGHAAVIAVLLKAGAKLNRATTRSCTPLFAAAQEGHRAAVTVLIEAGADVDILADEELTPLYVAAARGHEAVLALLIKAGADVNRTKDNGCTPLFIAAAQGHEAVMVALLEAGAQITAMNDGITPLMAATHEGHTSVAAALRRWTAGVRS